MTDYMLIIPILVAFFVTLFLLPYWIRKARHIGLVWEDMNKFSHEKVAGSGGIIAIIGFIISILVFIAYREFYLHSTEHLVEIFSLLLVVTLIAGVGLIDDLFGWQRGGLSRRSRLIMILISSIPLVVINAGKHIVNLPFLGTVDSGIFYPFILIPIGIVGASTTFNFLAGFNGLEAGQGILLIGASGLVAYLTGNSWLAVISFCMVAALIAFLTYNSFPARVFPGNSLTLSAGALLAIIAILGNFEKIAIFFFIPCILEVILKCRGKLIKHSFGRPNKDGTLDLKYPNIYGLTHLTIFLLKKLNIKPTERKVVYLIWLFQLAVIIITIIIFREGIFL